MTVWANGYGFELNAIIHGIEVAEQAHSLGDIGLAIKADWHLAVYHLALMSTCDTYFNSATEFANLVGAAKVSAGGAR